MTTFTRPSRADDAVPSASERRLRLRWLISRAAIAAARPDLVRPTGPSVILEWRLSVAQRTGVRGSAWLIDGESDPQLLTILSEGPGAWLDAGPFTHIDIPGLLAVSIDGAGRIRYAGTSLMALWGVPGGRYEIEPASAAVTMET